MADEPNNEHPEDIQSILSDLDAILTDMGGVTPAAPKAEEPQKPVEVPKPVEPPKLATPPKAEAPPPPAPKTPAPVEAPTPSPSIELAPREGLILPPDSVAVPKNPEPPKPAAKLPDQKPIELFAGPAAPPEAPKAPPAPVEPPKASPPPPPPAPAPKPAEPPKAAVDIPAAPPSPTAVPAPAPFIPTTKIEDLPADTPKEQIRRVAYLYTASSSGVKTAFAAFLSQAARTISKKPIFLREVLAHEVGAASDPNAVLQKALQVKASAILAVVDDWPPAKVDELSEACARANVLFRTVVSADAQKKSTAVDVIVDMMLLPGEG